MTAYLKENGVIPWLKEYIEGRRLPVKACIEAFGVQLPSGVPNDDGILFPALTATLRRVLRRRDKLPQYNTIEDALSLITGAKRIVVLTGAGISVSCGIPDFRSENGIYAILEKENRYALDDPTQMFDISFFRENPKIFYSFARSIYPSNFVPSPCHRFIKLLEDKDKLLRNYTQNIDTLETLAGVTRVLQCHGSFKSASCLQCRRQVDGAEIKDAIFAQEVPLCPVCVEAAKAEKPKPKKKKDDDDDDDESDEGEFPPYVMKPDITFFGEKLTDDFEKCLVEDREQVDLLIIIGTSLKVAPVSEIIGFLPHNVPQIMINLTPVTHVASDVVLLGNADIIVQYLSDKLSWTLPKPVDTSVSLGNATQTPGGSTPNATTAPVDNEPVRLGQSHFWLFDGAKGAPWVSKLEAVLAAEAS
jgi:NAD-dependent histone deacetylase SIR2